MLSKPLAGGDRAVALFNSSDTAQTITTTAARAGLPAAAGYRLDDLVTKQVVGTTGVISANVPPHATVLYRVHPGATHGLAPATAVTWQDVSTAQEPGTYRITLADHGAVALNDTNLRISAPADWTATPATVALPRIAPGATASATVTVHGPQGAPGTTVTAITATASYRARPAGVDTVSGEQTIVRTVPYPSLEAAFNNVGATSESDTAPGNFDGAGNSYSAQALVRAGATAGATISANGLSFTWPSAAAGTNDNVSAAGQEITFGGQGSALGFLGAEAGFASGTVTVAYTDGTTSSGQLGFPNWCCTPTDAYGAKTAFTTDHRNTPTGPGNFGIGYGVFTNTVPLTPGKTIRSVTLPSAAAIHVFALAVQP